MIPISIPDNNHDYREMIMNNTRVVPGQGKSPETARSSLFKGFLIRRGSN